MAAPFAAIEQRINAGVFAVLPNAIATIGAVTGVAVVFDKDYAEFMNVDGSKPAIHVKDSIIAGHSLPRGTAVSLDVDTTPYIIADKRPDGHGVTVIILEKA